HRSVTDSKGRTTQVALSAEQMEELTSLVRQSIGFRQERGDSVEVINAPFTTAPVVELPLLPWWQQPQILDLLRAGAVPAGLALVALLVFFGLLRPALKAALGPRSGSKLNAVVADPEPLPEPPRAPALE